MAFTIVRDDLARVEADAIVVPANTRLAITGGTVMAVAKAAGFRRMQRACNRLGGCPTGQAVATPGYRLHASHVIHAVGPIWQGGKSYEPQLLRQAYDSALHLALRLNAQSVALPLLSTGTYGYPVRPAFEIAVDAIRAFLEDADIDVILVVYDRRAVEEGSRLFGEIAEYIDDAQAQPPMERRERNFEADMLVDSVSLACETVGEAPSRPRCPNCGHEVPPSGWFCPQCGASLEPEGGMPHASAQYGSASMPEPPQAYARRDRADAGSAGSHLGAALESAAGAASSVLPRVSARRTELSEAHVHADTQKPDLASLLANMDESFAEMLLHLIDARGLTDAQVYKRANISRQHFSKIRNPEYRPKKKTVLALAVALNLTLPETNELLERAGYALSHNNAFDVIVEYFIVTGNYDMFAINEALFAYDQPLFE